MYYLLIAVILERFVYNHGKWCKITAKALMCRWLWGRKRMLVVIVIVVVAILVRTTNLFMKWFHIFGVKSGILMKITKRIVSLDADSLFINRKQIRK